MIRAQIPATLLAFFSCSTILLPAVAAEEPNPVSLDEIVVTEKGLTLPTKQSNESVYTGTEVTQKGIETQGARAASSVYEAASLVPGVMVESGDPYGLSAEEQNLRVRGIRGYATAMTVEGVPNWGGNPMGPRAYIYDTENIDSIAVYKGAVPADLGTAVGARGGAMELRLRRPQPRLSAHLSQSVGVYGYSRTFARVDSGVLPWTDTAFALSASHTQADKWKGPGEVGPRNNASLIVTQPVWTNDTITLWLNYNHHQQDLYRPLSYSETQDLNRYYRKDYHSNLTGVRAEDIHYFAHNRGTYSNRDALAIVPFTLHDSIRFELKAYASGEDAEIWGGSPARGGIVQKRTRDIERHGITSMLRATTPLATVTLGHWFEFNDMVIRTETRDPTTGAFAGHGMHTENDEPGTVHTPFAKLAGSHLGIDWQIGLKVFHYTDPASQGYTSSAPDYVLTPAADLYRELKNYTAFLPTLGVAYRTSDAAEVYAAYGRNQIRPYSYVPLVTLYNQNREAFRDAGTTLNDLFKGYDMEVSDSIELGSRTRSDWFELMPTVFFSKHSHLLTTVHDPRVGLSYAQNIGKATGYGLEMSTSFFLYDDLQLYVNPTYTVLEYDEDLTYQGKILGTRGQQVVDTPTLSVKAGALLGYCGFELAPRLRAVGPRYGDATHEERVPGHFVADLRLGYHAQELPHARELSVEFELTNLSGSRHISLIQASDDNRAGNASYHVGAPRAGLLSIAATL